MKAEQREVTWQVSSSFQIGSERDYSLAEAWDQHHNELFVKYFLLITQHLKAPSLFWDFANIHFKETQKYNINTTVAKMAQKHKQDKVWYDQTLYEAKQNASVIKTCKKI